MSLFLTRKENEWLTRATWDDIPPNWLKIPSTLRKNWGPETRRISDPERRGDFPKTEWLWTDTPNEKSSDGDKGIRLNHREGNPSF